MNADAELHQWVADWALGRDDLTPRPMFGCPAWFQDGKVRVCVIADSVTVKGSPGRVAEAKAQCAQAGDFIAHGRSMGKNWVSFRPGRTEAALIELRAWLDVLLSGAPPSGTAAPGS